VMVGLIWVNLYDLAPLIAHFQCGSIYFIYRRWRCLERKPHVTKWWLLPNTLLSRASRVVVPVNRCPPNRIVMTAKSTCVTNAVTTIWSSQYWCTIGSLIYLIHTSLQETTKEVNQPSTVNFILTNGWSFIVASTTSLLVEPVSY